MTQIRQLELKLQAAQESEQDARATMHALAQERAKLLDELRAIHDFAHDKSTGPAVPDALWEVRAMAARALTPAYEVVAVDTGE